MIPEDLRYTEEHEWIKIDGETAVIGITNHACEELGEIVFVETPEIGSEISQGDEFGSVESVKTVSSLYAPVSGTVTEINEELENNPDLVNESPYDAGWLIKVELADQAEIDDLMSPEEYETYLETL